MDDRRIRSIALAGGGVAVWMAAAALARLLKPEYCRVCVVEDPDGETLGTAAGTIPAFQRFHNLLGIDENDFVRRTKATFKLGVLFRDWTAPETGFFHTFCEFGGTIASVPFHHHWLRLRENGDESDIADYSIATVAAKLGRFTRTSADANSPLSLFSYAYHLDTGLYAAYLRAHALACGVERIQGKPAHIERNPQGAIEALVLEDGRRVAADFYIDCGAGLLPEPFEDWTSLLPCDRKIFASLPAGVPLPVHTTATARDAGWEWSIPLHDRTDAGYVYSSAFTSDDDAAEVFLRGKPAGTALRRARFRNGRPAKFWSGNCLALPGATVEPLEANAIHLIQTGILRFISTFPDRGFDPSDAEEYNRLAAMECERVRDFLVLHYCSAGRGDTAFWRHCRNIQVPDALRHKIELFAGSGRVNMLDSEHFAEQSWISLFLGHGIVPRRHDPLADVPPLEDVRRHIVRMAATLRAAAGSMPAHAEYLGRIAP